MKTCNAVVELKRLPAGFSPFLLQIHPSSFNKWWQEKRVRGLTTDWPVICAHLIIFVKRKIAGDFRTERKCHSCGAGDSAEGHLLDSGAIS